METADRESEGFDDIFDHASTNGPTVYCMQWDWCVELDKCYVQFSCSNMVQEISSKVRVNQSFF